MLPAISAIMLIAAIVATALSHTMAKKITEAYGKAAEKYQMKKAEVGLAFLEESKAHPEVELYHTDLTHPSPEGSKIAARVILEAVMSK